MFSFLVAFLALGGVLIAPRNLHSLHGLDIGKIALFPRRITASEYPHPRSQIRTEPIHWLHVYVLPRKSIQAKSIRLTGISALRLAIDRRNYMQTKAPTSRSEIQIRSKADVASTRTY